jgi:hypothetical protein
MPSLEYKLIVFVDFCTQITRSSNIRNYNTMTSQLAACTLSYFRGDILLLETIQYDDRTCNKMFLRHVRGGILMLFFNAVF